jgi:hypothetical protein
VKDDRVQVEEAISVFNLGKVAWLAEGVVFHLPKEFTALNAQVTMSDQGVDSVDKVGGRLRGTFPPGRHDLEFRWQLPYSGEKDVNFEVGLPPHVAVLRAMAAVSSGAHFSVVGFPEPEARTDAQGQRVLITEKQARRDELMESLQVRLEGLPTPGPGRVIATFCAGFGILIGIVLASQGGSKSRPGAGGKTARARLLAELLALEEAHRQGDVGPRTYERARQELIDRLARSLEAPEGSAAPA